MRTQIKLSEAVGRLLESVNINYTEGKVIQSFTGNVYAVLEIREADHGDESDCIQDALTFDPLLYGDRGLIETTVATEEEIAKLRRRRHELLD